ncbi:MucR family transcriptional regulator [Modestobacter sp. VKM Ac-2977]|uniref:MucR family transcriptional regulator n=1 Tax=Modestobacter sp. VKM Ac-2977 TaxID=3004131 RepID=UPI0022AAF2BE|nr:MucR family transcriptional regulator [Modestobacter sp. VKM Ac-2977]MCZ2818953.1 MucR family transcriptional regulator [Modestobacter sp. VKM Ac-2977]
MLHPVGPLPAVVYWRRRLLVLGCAVGVLGGGGWLGVAVATGSPDEDTVVTAAGDESVPAPALDQVVPSLAAVQLPTAEPAEDPQDEDPQDEEPQDEEPEDEESSAEALPVDGGPCNNDMIGVEVRPTPASSPVGSKPTFDLVVTNVSPVSCVRALDKGLQEIVMVDASGTRVWGSNDCFPEATTDPRTLQPGESVVFPVVWGGLSSTPGCTAERVPPAPGDYRLRGRLDTATSPDAAFTLT